MPRCPDAYGVGGARYGPTTRNAPATGETQDGCLAPVGPVLAERSAAPTGPAVAGPAMTEVGAGALAGAEAAPVMLGTPGSAIVPDPENGVFVARASMKADSGIRTRAVNARMREIMEAIVTVVRCGAGGYPQESACWAATIAYMVGAGGGHSPWGETLLGAGGRSGRAGSRQNRQAAETAKAARTTRAARAAKTRHNRQTPQLRAEARWGWTEHRGLGDPCMLVGHLL